MFEKYFAVSKSYLSLCGQYDTTQKTKKMTTKQYLQKAILENKKIKIDSMVFSMGYSLMDKQTYYYMLDDFKPSKYKELTSFNDFLNLIVTKIKYYEKKGYPNHYKII